ncbi:MAG: hypothetical protein HY248_05110, partial [Fimbriimonas ginsengisoli]|nr:hypothetical protein [Fimbriimonas ginsengisoli]
ANRSILGDWDVEIDGTPFLWTFNSDKTFVQSGKYKDTKITVHGTWKLDKETLSVYGNDCEVHTNNPWLQEQMQKEAPRRFLKTNEERMIEWTGPAEFKFPFGYGSDAWVFKRHVSEPQ